MHDLQAILTAVSDPTRRAIVDQLTRGPARVTDIAAPLPMTLAAVSKHIRILEEAGLVRRSRNGREHILKLDARPLRQVVTWANRYQQYWTTRLDNLEAFFKAERGSKS